MYLAEHKNARIFPIHCPQIKFTNRFGQPDAYVPMNPALHIDHLGQFILLVRLVNYRKFADYSFTLSEQLSNSRYAIVRGDAITNLMERLRSMTPVSIDYGQHPKYPTYWTGVEDIRFINSNELIITVPELHPKGSPAVFIAKLNGSTISDIAPPCPLTDRHEKNWMPLAATREAREAREVVYQLHPCLVIRNLQTNQSRTFNSLDCLKEYHGSTNSILHNDEHLLIVHKQKEHRWVRLSKDYSRLRVSEPFCFFGNTYIEFCCSLSKYDGNLYIAVGADDKEAFVICLADRDPDRDPDSVLTACKWTERTM